MFNNCFDSGFNCHQCSVSSKHMIVVPTDAILLLQTGLNIRTIARSRLIWPINVYKHINIVGLVIWQSRKESLIC